MFGRRTDGPRIFAVVGPRGAVGWFGMNDDMCSGRCQGARIEVEIAEDVGEGGEFWVGSGVAEEVESEDCLRDKSVPLSERELRITRRETREEVIFESLYCPFGRIAPMDMWRNKLEFDILFA